METKKKLLLIIFFSMLGTISLFKMDDSSLAWKIIVPISCFGIAAGTFLYGLLNSKK